MVQHIPDTRTRQLLPTLGALRAERDTILERVMGRRGPEIALDEAPQIEARLSAIDALIISRRAMALVPPLP